LPFLLAILWEGIFSTFFFLGLPVFFGSWRSTKIKDQEVIIDHLDDSDKDFSQSLEVQGDTKIHRVNMWTRNGKREKHIEHRKKNRNHYHQDERFELSKKIMIIIFFLVENWKETCQNHFSKGKE